MENAVEQARALGLSGQEALAFVREQQEMFRAERAERAEERRLDREHELELGRLTAARNDRRPNNEVTGKTPKLPQFADGTDQIDSYLQRFERFARTNNWPEENWATSLSTLLTGRALCVYSRLSHEDAIIYQELKTALMK